MLIEKREIAPHAHPLVRQMYELIRRQDASINALSIDSGVSVAAMVKWKYKHAPNVPTFEAVLNAMGYELTIQKRGNAA